jgi:PAS domain S-box-containing protein
MPTGRLSTSSASGEEQQLRATVASLERRLADAQSYASLRRHHDFLIEHTTDAVFCVGLRQPLPLTLSPDEGAAWVFEQGYLAAVNSACARAYGYNWPEEMRGLPVTAFLPRSPDNVAMVRATLAAGHRNEHAPTEGVDRHGARKVLLTSIVGRIADGHVHEYIGISKDITAQTVAEDALQARDGHLRLALEASAALTFDAHGQPIRLIGSSHDVTELLAVHAAHEETEARWAALLATLPIHDVDATTGREWWSPEDRERVRRHRMAALDPAGSGELAVEFRCMRADTGDVRCLLARGRTTFEDGPTGRRPVRHVGITSDITERVRAEAHDRVLLLLHAAA